jgi:flagellar FliJ protein
MKRFQFRLERLLTIRRYREREWEVKLAKAAGTCLKLEREIDEMYGEKARAFKDRFKYGAGDIEYLTASELYMQRLERTAMKKEKELAVKNVERDKIKNQYLEVSKKRKILDKLRERRAAEYYKEAKDEEIKSMDDMNSALYPGSGK